MPYFYISMPTSKLKNQLHLHFIVFIWGFTAILGALITIDAMPLVWYRVLLASITLFVFFKINVVHHLGHKSDLLKFAIGGILVALHWVLSFTRSKYRPFQLRLITLSSSAFFVVII